MKKIIFLSIGAILIVLPIIFAYNLVQDIDIIVFPSWRHSNVFESDGAIIARAMMVTFIFAACEAVGFYFLRKADKEKENKPE